MPVKGNGKTSNHQTNNYERDTKRDSSSTEEFKHSNGKQLDGTTSKTYRGNKIYNNGMAQTNDEVSNNSDLVSIDGSQGDKLNTPEYGDDGVRTYINGDASLTPSTQSVQRIPTEDIQFMKDSLNSVAVTLNSLNKNSISIEEKCEETGKKTVECFKKTIENI